MPQIVKRQVVSSPSKTAGLPVVKSKPRTSLRDYISVFFGQPGVGKTTFVNQLSDRVLFASTDRGTRFLETLTVECFTYEDFLALLDKLEAGGSKNYDYLAIDHVDDWANMVETYVLKKLGVEALTDAGYGKGWSTLKTEIKRFMNRVKALGMGIVFIAHEEFKTVKVGSLDVDKCQPMMSKQAWNAIIPLADIVGYCAVQDMKDKAGKRTEVRVLRTSPRPDLYAKDRTSRTRPSTSFELLDGRRFVATFGN